MIVNFANLSCELMLKYNNNNYCTIIINYDNKKEVYNNNNYDHSTQIIIKFEDSIIALY